MHFIERFQREKFHGPSWARDFGVNRNTIYVWRARYLKSGEPALKASISKGRPRRLSAQQEQQVQHWLKDPTSPIGPHWTPIWVREVIGREFGVWFHPCHLYKLLGQWGWRCEIQ
ncbi:helix-turn-helix domain-containing protein [Deinococcus cellulosilyticus]